jgi:hypothetical protein
LVVGCWLFSPIVGNDGTRLPALPTGRQAAGRDETELTDLRGFASPEEKGFHSTQPQEPTKQKLVGRLHAGKS